MAFLNVATAPMAVRKFDALNQSNELSAFARPNVIADGFVDVNILPPIVVAPNDVRPVAAVKPVAPPSHLLRSEYAVFQLLFNVASNENKLLPKLKSDDEKELNLK